MRRIRRRSGDDPHGGPGCGEGSSGATGYAAGTDAGWLAKRKGTQRRRCGHPGASADAGLGDLIDAVRDADKSESDTADQRRALSPGDPADTAQRPFATNIASKVVSRSSAHHSPTTEHRTPNTDDIAQHSLLVRRRQRAFLVRAPGGTEPVASSGSSGHDPTLGT